MKDLLSGLIDALGNGLVGFLMFGGIPMIVGSVQILLGKEPSDWTK